MGLKNPMREGFLASFRPAFGLAWVDITGIR
jgi:hypothetical protein